MLRHVLETHTHADHLSGAARLGRETGAEVAMSEGSDSLVATRRLHDGDRIALGAFEIAVLATPGHTSDSLSFRTDGALFTGDSLLIGGSGRCDFIGGSPSQLYRSFEALRAPPNETTVYPGHDYRGRTHTTIADERAGNPLFGERDERAFVARFAASRPEEPANMRLVLEANKTGAPAGVGRIGAAALKQRLEAGERLTLLDVRSPAEHEGSRLHGSLNVPLEKLGSSLAAVPAGAPIVIVCATGTRSALAAPALRDRAGVLVLEGASTRGENVASRPRDVPRSLAASSGRCASWRGSSYCWGASWPSPPPPDSWESRSSSAPASRSRG